MKKILSLLLCLLLAFSTAACAAPTETPGPTPEATPETTPAAEEPDAAEPQAEGTLTPGTYSVTQRGYADDFTVSVTVDENSITNVTVDATLDTLGTGEMAQKELAKSIVEHQSTNVDMMAGATISSSTFLYAVRQALTEAGATDDMFAEDCTTEHITDRSLPEGYVPDIIVVGGGLAGVVASMTAAEEGAKVLLVEQESYLGGTSAYAGGAIAESGSALQPAESHNAVTADSLFTWLNMSNAETPTFDPGLARAMADASAPAYDKLVEWGMKPTEMTFFGNGAGYYVWQDAGEYESSGWHIFHNLEPAMQAKMDAGNLAILMNTKATGLLQDETGAVNGIVTEEGETLTASAVILATGGYTNNLELMEQVYDRYASYGAGSATGEMQQAAIALGAQTYAMDQTRYEPGMVNTTGENNEQVHYEVVVATSGYVWVNADGERVSVEDAKNAQPWKEAENNTIYVLLDQGLLDTTTVLKLGNSSHSQLDPENKNFYRLLEEGTCIYSGDTIEEVAEKAGVDPANLAATVETYNGYCQTGVDEDFGRAPENMQSLEGPFYLVETIGGVKGTSGGLVIDESARVLNEQDQPIPGLYAAGEICGTLAFNGNCVYNGGCFIICSSFGRIAAQNALTYVSEN